MPSGQRSDRRRHLAQRIATIDDRAKLPRLQHLREDAGGRAQARPDRGRAGRRVLKREHTDFDFLDFDETMIRHVIDRIAEVRPDLSPSIEITRGSTKALVKAPGQQRLVRVRLV